MKNQSKLATNASPRALPPPEPKYKPEPLACGYDKGMTLLDYFAGQALCGFLANPSVRCGTALEAYANDAYLVARAMIGERERIENGSMKL